MYFEEIINVFNNFIKIQLSTIFFGVYIARYIQYLSPSNAFTPTPKNLGRARG